MKIALIAFDWTRAQFLLGVEKTLRAKGHEVALFLEHDLDAAGGLSPSRRHMAWTQFRFAPLEDYGPDRVVFFNGYAPEASGATATLAERYKARFVERGWLPQRGAIYADTQGLGARSRIAAAPLDSSVWGEELALTKHRLRGHYAPGPRPEHLPDSYVFVPLQLEHDTSILLDSHYFKTMASLVTYVACVFYDMPVVVRPHPYHKGAAIPAFPNVRVETAVPCNTLSAHARCVIGINSTSLIEALVHEKPVGMLGENVISNSLVTVPSRVMLARPRQILGFAPPVEKIWRVLHNLSALQAPQNDPSEVVLDAILREA